MLLLASTSWVGVRFLINLISNIYFSSLCVFGGDGNDDDVDGGVCVCVCESKTRKCTIPQKPLKPQRAEIPP